MGAHAPGGGGGGFTPVSCLLAREASFDIHTAAGYPVLWDALYDNIWDQNPLEDIPAGLGLTFAFDGSSDLVTTTSAGVWSFSYFGLRATDDALTCHFALGIGFNFPWVQQIVGGVGTGAPYLAGSLITPLPSGTDIDQRIEVSVQGASNPSNVTQVYLSIVRLA